VCMCSCRSLVLLGVVCLEIIVIPVALMVRQSMVTTRVCHYVSIIPCWTANLSGPRVLALW
jgi:hypothetical protein